MCLDETRKNYVMYRYIISPDDAKRQIDDAEAFYREVEKYIVNLYK